ncbi:MAG: hypothetical protein WCP99_08615 [Burkholderiales bacterium]
MKSFLRLVTVVLFFSPMVAVFGETGTFRAGIIRASVAAETPFEILVWYPTLADEKPWQAGPFTVFGNPCHHLHL